MKGVVFTEFLDFVGAKLGRDVADDIIESSDLPSGGAYTAVGTYDYTEMQALVVALAQRTGASVPDLLAAFGRHLGHRFGELYPDFFKARGCLFDFLESVDNHIHVEVHKLYPDAELPKFEIHARDHETFHFDYRSCRPLASLAQGLILGASDYFGEKVAVTHERHDGPSGDFVRFAIERVA